MSSSSTTAPCSRSSSPATPESSDGPEPLPIQNEFETSPWCQSMRPKPVDCAIWEPNGNAYLPKNEEVYMLRLDDLIEEHAYDDSPSSHFSYAGTNIVEKIQTPLITDPMPSQFASNILFTPPNGPPSMTKPIPPPASRPRKRDHSTTNPRVVYPPKESCFNLPIMIPSIPECGTKSRVETQVRVVVELADTSSYSGDPVKYDRVGSWKWLRLPPGTATKKRTQKQGRIDPLAEDTLQLSTTVTCASPPHNRVLSCSSCQTREAKRVERKLAARVRPARSDSDSMNDTNPTRPKSKLEDTTSIIQFNCAEFLDFTTGSAVLPLRLTCYCRHHREKVGFNIHFTMMDHSGRTVGMGTSRPIMITDDHKTTGNIHRSTEIIPIGFAASNSDWNSMSMTRDSGEQQPSSKRRSLYVDTSNHKMRRRSKPYDSVRSNGSRLEASLASPTTSPSITRSSTPAHRDTSPSTLFASPSTDLVSPPPSIFTADQNGTFAIPDSALSEAQAAPTFDGLSSPLLSELPSSSTVQGVLPHAMPFLFYNPNPNLSTLPIPKIHRLIPACGPTYGGIEVTVLGSNFCPSVQLNCVFGDVTASSTQRWSDNTLVCVLPPRAAPGVVAVWLEGIEKEDDGAPPSLFTYSDESDRALMELALQVVGLKMTGKIEDAKNVAIRIVGSANDRSDCQNRMGMGDMMQMSSSLSVRDIRPLLLSRAGDAEDFENLVIRCLSIVDTPLDYPTLNTSLAISHPTSSGQTLLHLATFLGFTNLVSFLISHDVDVDVRDRNGYTALHFAVLSGSKKCAELLVEGDADLEIVNVYGKTAVEEAEEGFFEGMGDEDEEAEWGDVEEDVEDMIVRRYRRVHRRAEAADSSAPSTPVDKPTVPPDIVEETKQSAWIIDVIQRRLVQLYEAHPGLTKKMPLVTALPHIRERMPMVFPVYVSVPAWPSFLGEKRVRGDVVDGQMGAIREWVASWMVTSKQAEEEEGPPPPVYTPRTNEGTVVGSSRRVGYENEVTVPDQEVNAYGYQPGNKSQKLQKKHDRMLLLFWIPVLLLSLLWSFHNGVQFVYHTIKNSFPRKLL